MTGNYFAGVSDPSTLFEAKIFAPLNISLKASSQIDITQIGKKISSSEGEKKILTFFCSCM